MTETNSSRSAPEPESNKSPISERKKIFLSDILPALITAIGAVLTAIIGGIVIAQLVPQIQYNYSTRQTINSKKLDILLATTDALSGWMTQWRRTNNLKSTISELQEKIKSSKSPSERLALGKEIDAKKSERKKELDTRRDFFLKLQSHIILAEHLFGSEVKRAVQDFRNWYDDMVIKDIDIEVEPGKPADEKRKRILQLMGAELGQSLK